MDFCDTSMVDWEAWGTLGTWAVGVAAAWLAFSANRLNSALRNAENGREERAARFMLATAREEILFYGRRLKLLVRDLSALDEDDARDKLSGAAVACAALESTGLTDHGQSLPSLSCVPEELTNKMAKLYATERSQRAVLGILSAEIKRLRTSDEAKAQYKGFLKTSENFKERAEKAFEVANSIGTYLGLPAEADQKAEAP